MFVFHGMDDGAEAFKKLSSWKVFFKYIHIMSEVG